MLCRFASDLFGHIPPSMGPCFDKVKYKSSAAQVFGGVSLSSSYIGERVRGSEGEEGVDAPVSGIPGCRPAR